MRLSLRSPFVGRPSRAQEQQFIEQLSGQLAHVAAHVRIGPGRVVPCRCDGDEPSDLIGLASAHPQAGQDAAGRIGTKLAEKGSQRQSLVVRVGLGRRVKRGEGTVPRFRRQGLELGERRGQDARLGHEADGPRWRCRCQHAADLAADALLGDPLDVDGVVAYGPLRDRFDGEVKACRDAHRPQQAQGIFIEASVGVAHGADQPGGQIALAVGRVDQPGHGPWPSAAPGDGVDGQVAAGQILEDVTAEGDAVGATMIGVAMITTEGRDSRSRERGRCRSGSDSCCQGRHGGCAPAAHQWLRPSR